MSSRDVLQRFELLRTVFRLSQEQRQALAEHRLDEFVALLEERDALIEEFRNLNIDTSTPDNVIPFPGTVGPAGKAHVSSDDAIALEGLLRAILHVDAENERWLQREVSELREAIGQVGRAKVTVRSYRPIVSALATVIDESA